MKVQQITQENRQLQTTPNFRGGADAFLRFFATNQAMGANLVDVAFMVTPRTASDTIRRGPVAGLETGRREASGTANHTLIGVYGSVAGAIAAAAMGMNKKFGINANQIMAAPETINILAENKANYMNSQKEYLAETLRKVKAFNPESTLAGADGYINFDKLKKEDFEEIVNFLDNAISNEKLNFKEWANNKNADSLDVLINKITEKTGAQSKYILESAQREGIKSETNLRTLLEDIFKVSKAFNKEKVVKAFEEQKAAGKSILENNFIKSFARYGKTKSAAGFAIASAVGMSIQPLNMYLTKKKTGQDGFVGVEGRTKDDSTGFKFLKAGSAAAFFAMVLSTLNGEKKGLSKLSPKGFMGKMAFKGFWPTLSQLKGVYGLTIISRLFSARDKDELRESLTKDTLGFLSWLVLGDFVNKMTAEGLDKKLSKSVMNRTNDVAKKGFWERVFKSSLKNRDEILIEALAEAGVSTVKNKDGNVVAKSFKEMLKDLNNIGNEALKVSTKKRLGVLNKAQLAGYAFSGLVLGLGIPNLNIYITNKLDKKRKAQAEAEKQLETAKA